MRKFLISAFVYCFLALSAGDVFACSCESDFAVIVNGKPVRESLEQLIEKAYKDYPFIFSAKIIKVKKNWKKISKGGDKSSYFASKTLVTVEVEKFWKKKLTKRLVISTGLDGGDCGYHFEVGKRYLIYAWGEDLGVSICSRTALLSEAGEDIKILDQIEAKQLK